MNTQPPSAARPAFPLNRRHLLAAGAGALAAGRAARARAADDLTLSVWRYKVTASYFFADAGVADTPYRVTYADLPGGTMVLEALASNALDYAFMSEIPPIFSIPSDLPIRLIATVRGDVANVGILVRGDSGIRTAADLRGKRVSYVRATSNHYYLIKILARAGLGFSDIVPVPLSVQDSIAAFRSGHLDAVVAGGYAAWILKHDSGARWLISDMAGFYPGNFVIAANRDALQDPAKAAAIADYLTRERAVWDWAAGHGEQWAARWAEVTGVPADYFLDEFRARHHQPRLTGVTDTAIRDQQDVADTFFTARAIDRRVDVRPLWDPRFAGLLGG